MTRYCRKSPGAGRGLSLRRLTAVLLSSTLLPLLYTNALAQAARSPHQEVSRTATTSPGPIIAGPSRSECLEPSFDDTGLLALQTAISDFDTLTGTSVSCVVAYLNGAQNWSQWDTPWVTAPQYGFTSWVAEEPQIRQLVLQVDLIPDSLEDVSNPLSWERSCAAGDFNAYATQLGASLVAAGFQNSVLRLGAEMNGKWEADFIGTSLTEQHLWASCFANEVTSLRQAPGENFLIDWNPNACVEDVPYKNFYPGSKYVDILGLDFYDVGCDHPKTPLTFAQLSNEPDGLKTFEAFAKAQHKPMSFPEWGLASIPSGDDPAYIDGIGETVTSRDFAFEAYFDAGAGDSLPLSVTTPLSVAAFHTWFAGT
jgi:hypothetical protein